MAVFVLHRVLSVTELILIFSYNCQMPSSCCCLSLIDCVCKYLSFIPLTLSASFSPLRPSAEEQRRPVLHQREADHRHAAQVRHRRDHLPLPASHGRPRNPGSSGADQHDPDSHGEAGDALTRVAMKGKVLNIFKKC